MNPVTGSSELSAEEIIDAGRTFQSILVSGKKLCVEVLQPSQPNGVMLSTVSSPNHTFTRQVWSSKRLTSIGVTRITEIPEYYRNTGIPVNNIGIPVKDTNIGFK